MQIEESRSKQFLTRKAFTAATGCFAMMGFTSTCWGAIVPYISEKNNFSISLSGVIYGVFMFHTLVGTVLMQSLSQKIDLIWFARGGTGRGRRAADIRDDHSAVFGCGSAARCVCWTQG